ncbi:3-phenylpropionate/cinnamic acid dioxygenase subunit beta [Streptomyces sp. T028]|uniref:3-phenylpropionate/cinnamic acid dioxygenase subunit beta n=1 Tax=Streptomyces sp. T028 TaxID=3394379 RepID=UPI003A86351E
MTTVDEETSADVPGISLDVDFPTYHEISQVLYLEAKLLDERRYEEWFALFADDIRYWMPIRYNRLSRELASETSGVGEPANFEEDKSSLWQRIVRLRTGMAWAEDPPSRARHIVTNISVEPGSSPDEFDTRSYFLTYRTRGDSEWDMWVGRRDDVLRRVGEHRWQIADRTITLDQATILSKNLSLFF